METAAQIVAQYTPRAMLTALRQAPEPSRFLLDRLVSRRTEHDTDIIEIDVEKGNATVAAFVSRVGAANVVGKRSSSTNLHAIPYIYESMPFTAKDLTVRSLGANVYDTGTPRDRLSEKIGEWLEILRNRNVANREKQLCDALQTGKILVQGKDVDYEVDFQMAAAHLITNSGAAIWGSGTEDKIAQLEADAELSRNAGAPPPTQLYLGKDAAKLWLADTDVLANLDNRRVNMGQINIEQLSGQFATYLGSFSRVGLNVEVFSYQGTYKDTSGTTQYYLDPDNYVLTSPTVRIEEHFGMIENLNHGSFMGQEFPDIIIAKNGRSGEVTLESGPLVALHQPDGVVRRAVK